MVKKTNTVLRLIGSYVINKKTFVSGEHRDKIIETYSAQIIYTNN